MKHNANLNTNGIITTTQNANTNFNVLNTNFSNNKLEIERDTNKKSKNHNNIVSFNNLQDFYPIKVENGKKMITKININPNIQELLKEFKPNIKLINKGLIMKKKQKYALNQELFF